MPPFYTNFSMNRPHTLPAQHNYSSLTFDEMIRERCTDNDARLRNAISYSSLGPASKQQLANVVKHIRVYRTLFMHTYVHLVSCCQGRNLEQLLRDATDWMGQSSVRQLANHSLIRERLLRFGTGHTCNQHRFLAQRPITSEDNDDVLCLLLYCCKKRDLYELPNKESEQIIELLWQCLSKHQDDDVVRRLRACIYRMARKSAYLPRALQIGHSLISNEQPFGAGANGLLVRAKMDGRDVVIKKILCDDRTAQRKRLEMLASEAILWKTLKHENIVPFLGIVAEGFHMGLVSPFFENGSIKHYMRRCDPRHWPTLTRKWAEDLAQGLKFIHCHEPPVIHGDIKGDNVLVDDHGRACLGDFGQSHASDSGKYLDSTRVGLAACPLHWMAPEIMRGERTKASDKSDIYSFGCVLYEMLSGTVPFEDLPPQVVFTRVTNGERPNRPGSVSRGSSLWNAVKACWMDGPETRPSATQLVSLLH